MTGVVLFAWLVHLCAWLVFTLADVRAEGLRRVGRRV